MSAMQERRRMEHEARIAHREKLERQYGVVGHKRSEKLYDLAWEYGHSGGFEEVANYYIDLVELLK